MSAILIPGTTPPHEHVGEHVHDTHKISPYAVKYTSTHTSYNIHTLNIPIQQTMEVLLKLSFTL